MLYRECQLNVDTADAVVECVDFRTLSSHLNHNREIPRNNSQVIASESLLPNGMSHQGVLLTTNDIKIRLRQYRAEPPVAHCKTLNDPF